MRHRRGRKQVNASRSTNRPKYSAFLATDPLLSLRSWGHTPDWEHKNVSFLSLRDFCSHSHSSSRTLLTPFISSSIYPSLRCSSFLPNSTIYLSGLQSCTSFLSFILNLLPQSPPHPTFHLCMSYYASSSTNLSPLPFLKTPCGEQCRCVFLVPCKFFCVSSCMLRGRLVSQSVSVLSETWWELLVLHSVTLDYPFQHSKFLSETAFLLLPHFGCLAWTLKLDITFP